MKKITKKFKIKKPKKKSVNLGPKQTSLRGQF